jgi:hypothetical protein
MTDLWGWIGSTLTSAYFPGLKRSSSTLAEPSERNGLLSIALYVWSAKFVCVGDLGCRTVPNPTACQTGRINPGLHALPFAASPSMSQSQSGLYQEGDHDIDDEAAHL